MLTTELACYLYEHCLGKPNAATRRHLCTVLRCQDRRLREAVEYLRRDGHAVGVAEGGGYYMASTADEVAEIVADCRKRVEALCQTANLLRRNWPEVVGLQLVLVESDGQAKLIA